MNREQIYDVLRQLGIVGVTLLVAKGYVTTEQASVLVSAAEQGGPALLAVGLIAYGVWKKRDAAKALEADKIPDAAKALAADKIPGVSISVNKNTAPRAVVEVAKEDTNSIKLTGHQ
jgi:hypothetical protein